MKNNFYRRRNTPAFTFMAWGSFIIAMSFYYVGVWNLEQNLSTKGFYAVTGLLIVITSFVLQKIIRDNDEDKFIREHNHKHRFRNTPAFSFMAWAGFVLAIAFEYVGLYNLQEPLYVQGYYAIGAAFLIVTCLVLQKTIRDNDEDNLNMAELESEQVESL